MDGSHIQAVFDGMSAKWQRERAETQMTLGKMINALKDMPEGATVECLVEPDSYRGYYSDLAFEPGGGRMPAAELLALCRGCMGQVFTGYKGGEYVMGALTPLWLAPYGSCGDKIMGFAPDGSLVTECDS